MAVNLPLGLSTLYGLVNAGTDRAALIDSDALFVGIKVYEPGEVFGNHFHQGYDEFFACIEGSLDLWIGRSTHLTLSEGTSALCRRGVQHYLVNSSPTRTTLLYAKVPMIADDSVLVDWEPPRAQS